MALVEVDVVGTTIRAVDVGGNEVEVGARVWDQPAPGPDLSMMADATCAGRTRELVLPWTHTWIVELDDDGDRKRHLKLGDERRSVSLEDGRYELGFDLSPRVVVGFEGAATVRRNENRQAVVSFAHPTAVTVGATTWLLYPTESVTVPRTTEGVATALGHLSAGLRTTGVNAAGPLHRQHPPRIAFGDEYDVPDAVRDATHDTGVTVAVPDDLEALLPAAPLAYYLGADVAVEPRERPLLRAPSVGLAHEFDPLPSFQHGAAALLRRVFMLDNLVRLRRQRADLRELDVLETLPLDLDRLATADVAERLRAYLAAPYERLEPVLPEWHYRVYLDPELGSARLLPYVLARVGQVMVPDGSFGSADAAVISADADGAVAPFVGWAAEDRPRDAYELHPRAFENDVEYVDSIDEPFRVAVVGGGTAGSRVDAVVEAVRSRAGDDPTVDVVRNCSADALRDRFAAHADLLAFVGAYDDGFVCTDGTVSPGSLDGSNARVVLADAAGSAAAANSLVEGGSVAVVCRGSGPMDATTRRVFLELLVEGASVNHAVECGRYFGDAGPDFRTVGDGLARFSKLQGMYPIGHEFESMGDGRFRLAGHTMYPNAGLLWAPDTPESRSSLVGSGAEFVADAADVRAVLSKGETFLVHDGDLYWPNETQAFYPFL